MEKRPSFSYSSSSPAKIYDVFLSFRGDDTRYDFTSHLSLALRKIGLFNIFKDDYALSKGKQIEHELLDAIKDSRSAVVVLSKNYADSQWCLKELAKIVECMGDSGRIRTIFYHVNPSDVRKQKGSFGEAMEKHEKEAMEKDKKEAEEHKNDLNHKNDPHVHQREVESWRNALTKIGKQAGYPIDDKVDEAMFIQDFIAKLSTELGASLKTLQGFVGMTSRLKQLDSFVLKSSSDVCFIGNCGMGGIGKSTLATAYYKRMSHKFDGCSFLPNIRETCNKRENGLVYLQNRLLSDILGDSLPEIGDVGSGVDMIRSRLRRKKVLIVLDDVSKSEQLDALADSHKKKIGSDHDQLDIWFGSGSIIIVTTRNEGLLSQRYKIYRAEHLNPNEALELFTSKAFESNEPPEEYKELSKQVVEYAEYLPLALIVLGSLLGTKKKDVSKWKGALSRLENCPAKEIVEKLEISYDDLEDTDKRFFLDIACFFKGHDQDSVIPILDSCGFNSEYGISNLVERSLLELRHGRVLWMRDLLQKMGQDIVRRESSKPGGPSRLWDVKEFKRILGRKTGMENVEAIVVTFQKESRMPRFGALSNMEKLRLLIIRGSFDFQAECDSSGRKLDSLSNELHFLEWNRFPFKEFPSDFEPYRLVELKLSESNLQRLWNNSIELPNLKVINLKDSRYFSTFEDFSVVPNLERLILEGCIKLLEIHSSISLLGMLTILNLKNCTSLEKLPPCIKDLSSLENLNLNGCGKLCEIPEDIGDLQNLKELDLRESGIKHLPSSIKHFENLETLISKEIVNLSKNPGLSKIFDVFLSFRGEDTRRGFTSYLYDALVREGIKTVFDDNHNLERGESISAGFMKAIQGSRCAVVVLSENYASSRWCLTELCQIVECMDTSGLIVVPIFYRVNPSHVRKLTGRYGYAFDSFERNLELHREIKNWRHALTTVGNIAGWTLEATDVEAHFIRDLTADLSQILDRPSKKFSDDLSEKLSRHLSEDQFEIESVALRKEIYPTIGKASFSSDPYSSEMLAPSDDNHSDESFPEEYSIATAFTSLKKHFQDPYGATTSFDIVVPGSEIPIWFTNQSPGESVSIKINPNWCDSNWMGLALAVCFRANPSNVLYCDMKLDNNDWKVRTRDYDYATMGNTDQIWLFYHPRHEWPTKELLNSYFNLDFSFLPRVPFRDNFGPCGVRLVYQKDIKELTNESPNRKDQFQHGTSTYFNDLSHQKGGPPPVPKSDSTDGGHFREHLRIHRRSF